MKRLTEIGKMIQVMSGGKYAASNWKISDDIDLRRKGGILVGSDGAAPIMPGMWPSFDQITDAIKERDTSAAERDMALEQLKKLGIEMPDSQENTPRRART